MKGDGMMRGNFARIAVSLAAGGCLMLTNVMSAADDPKPEKAPAKKEAPAKPKYKSPLTEDQVQVPDGKPAELEKAIQQAGAAVGASGLPQADGMKLYVFTVTKAADKLAAHKEATAKQKSTARAAKFQALQMGNRLDKKLFGAAFDKMTEDLIKNDPKSQDGQLAVAIRFFEKNLQGADLPKTTIDELVLLAKTHPENNFMGQLFAMAAGKLESGNQTEDAKKLLKQGVGLIKNKQAVAMLEGTLRKLSIIGSVMEIAGPTLGGSEFDLKSLKGKVVLVDFWATWCGPCIAELPNVKKVYDKYHTQGFEIVSISLDKDRSALEGFVKEEKISWPQIIFTDAKDLGWSNPLARKYGIDGIPAMYLIGRDGKAARANVRGEKALDDAVAELLKQKPKAALAN